jgi:hypothetical protein
MPRVSVVIGTILALAAPPAALLATGCKEPAPPGTRVGSFALEGTLEENTCGQGFAPALSISFVAELRRDGDVAYWRMGSTGPRSQGTIDDQGEFRFQQQSSIDGWPADAANGIPPCRFLQTETIEGQVELAPTMSDAGTSDAGGPDAGASDAGLTQARVLSGTNTIEIGVVPGFDCSLALVSAGAGGQFPSLPCRASYELEGATTP